MLHPEFGQILSLSKNGLALRSQDFKVSCSVSYSPQKILDTVFIILPPFVILHLLFQQRFQIINPWIFENIISVFSTASKCLACFSSIMLLTFTKNVNFLSWDQKTKSSLADGGVNEVILVTRFISAVCRQLLKSRDAEEETLLLLYPLQSHQWPLLVLKEEL